MSVVELVMSTGYVRFFAFVAERSGKRRRLSVSLSQPRMAWAS